MPAPSDDSARLLGGIKALLKERGLRYRDLAKGLGVSEPTIKRCLSTGDMTMARLLAIAELLGVSLGELAEKARLTADAAMTLTPAQEEALAERPDDLAYYMALRALGSPERVEARHGISKKSSRRYLARLEALGLLERWEGGKVRIKRAGAALVWNDAGPLGRLHTQRFMESITERALSGTSEGHRWLGSRGFDDEQYEAFRKDLDDLVRRWRVASTLAPARSPRRTISFLFLADAWKDDSFAVVPET